MCVILIQFWYRFECPLVAATIQRGLHHPEFGSWVYAPLANVDAARDWVDKTVYYVTDPSDPESFLQSTVEKHNIPYVLADGSEQFVRVYLSRPDCTLNTYLLSLHTSHSVLDAKPGLNALSLLLEYITTPGLPGIDELAWGTEHKNLPPGPITVTGGPLPAVSSVWPSRVRSATRPGIRDSVARAITCRVRRSAATVSSSISRGSHSGAARRTSSWCMNISPVFTTESTSFRGEKTGGPEAILSSISSYGVDSVTCSCTLAV